MNDALSFDVAIVGGGPAGIGIAVALEKRGVASVCLIERNASAGGVPARYGDSGGVPTFIDYRRGRVVHGGEYARVLLDRLARTRARLLLESQVIAVDAGSRTITAVGPERGLFAIAARAIVFATGAREQSAAERTWIAGARPARVLFTLQLVDLMHRCGVVPGSHPLIAGSDLIAYAAAAKLADAGAPPSAVMDTRAAARAPAPARWFFRRWTAAPYAEISSGTSLIGDAGVEGLSIDSDPPLACDAVVLSGSLTPNSELLVQAGLAVRTPRQVPVASPSGTLSAAGLFAAGNVLGDFHGADWCYWNGKRVGSAVARFLRR
jgi:NADPH-dependent 2,4-dienoyl-CoA reductase/sulfur reductase-like enzyme